MDTDDTVCYTSTVKPISVSPRRNGSYCEQVADELRKRIARKEYPVGTPLPSLREIAKSSGASLNVVRHALSLLKAEGLVRPRPRIGTIVLKPTDRAFRSRVLFVVPEGNFAFYMATLLSCTQAHLQAAGHDTSQILLPLDRQRKISTAPLRRLPTGHYDLAVTLNDANNAITEELRRLHIPFVTLGTHPANTAGTKGLVFLLIKAGADGFVKDCAQKRPKSVLELVKENSVTEPHAVDALKALGIRCHRLVAPRIFRGNVPETAEVSALVAMNKFLDQGNVLPEVLFLTDDYMARGAFTALLSHGIRIPQDIKVVAFSVKGHGPVLDVPLTRIEVDPFADARTLADGLLAVLSGKPLPRTCVLKSAYKPGSTF